MAVFLQIVFLNMVVSCDNVGVIALATRDLADKDAGKVQRIGIGLSLVLKIIFIGIIGYLLQVEWMHIRMIGGLMLLYVTFQMLGQSDQDQPQSLPGKGVQSSVRGAILTIIAADISMSLDNVVAILGIVSSDGQGLGVAEYLLVIGAMLICMPLLLWFSGAVTRLMERFPVVTYLCAGYLVYTAIKIIAEDPASVLFLEAADFSFVEPAAILCGALIVLYGLTGSRAKLSKRAKRGTLLLYAGVTISAILMVMVLSYLDSASSELGSPIQRMILDKVKSGANAVYLLGMESEVLCFATAILVGMRAGSSAVRKPSRVIRENMRGMLVFAFLYLIAAAVGLSYTFGIGTIDIFSWSVNLLLLMLLLLTYPALFTLFAVLTRSRPLSVVLSLLYLFAESVVTVICTVHDRLLPLAGFFPKYYLSAFVMSPMTPILSVRIILISAFFIASSYFIIKCRIAAE